MVGCKTICLEKFYHVTYADCHTTRTPCGMKKYSYDKTVNIASTV